MKSSLKRTLKSRQVGLVKTHHLISGDLGVAASLVVQDLTYLANDLGVGGNSITIEYTDTELQGAEVVTVVGNAISVGIESGVSTATEVKAAIDGSAEALALISVSISGTAGTAQVTAAAAPLAGGVDTVSDDAGIDRSFVESVVVNGVGDYTITVIEPSRRDLIVAGLVPLSKAVLNVSAIDESSVSITCFDDSGAAVEAAFYLTLIHSTLLDTVF